mgnify:CR=1 FL=1
MLRKLKVLFAATLLDNFNTKIFFRAINPETARWISRVLGSFEQREVTENLSYGANTMRDGVNLSDHVKSHSLISETEIMSLKDLEAYIKFPENLPVTKLKMKIEKGDSLQAPFILKEIVPYRNATIHEQIEKTENQEEMIDSINNKASLKTKKKTKSKEEGIFSRKPKNS